TWKAWPCGPSSAGLALRRSAWHENTEHDQGLPLPALEPAPVHPRREAEPQRLRLSVIVPVLDEEDGLGALIDRLRPVLERTGLSWEVLFVDDGSRDATLAAIKELYARDKRFKAISLSRNFGKEVATAAGLAYVQGDAAVIIDADLQHPPE